jgi:hypothetical protein
LSHDILIHVGYPKAASTWLQEHVFTDRAQGFLSPWGHRAGLAIQEFVIVNPFRYSPDEARAAFADGLSEARKYGLVPVLSEETLVGDPVSGRYWGRTAADHIHAAFPEARIIICIREQKSFILSAYREHVKIGGTYSLERFLGALAERPGFAGICQLDALEYDLVIDYYERLFGKRRVLTLVFEELDTAAADFLGRLYSFAQVKPSSFPVLKRENVGYKGFTLKLRRVGNRYVPRPDVMQDDYPLSRRLLDRASRLSDYVIPNKIHDSAQRRLEAMITEFIGDYFRASNRRTATLLGSRKLLASYDL